MAKVYVAASFEQRTEVKAAYKLLRSAGHSVTADWTTHKEITSLPSQAEREELTTKYALEDVGGVESAEVFILLLGDRKSTGAHIELGIALGAKLPYIYIVGDSGSRNQLFYEHPRILKVSNIKTVIEQIAN